MAVRLFAVVMAVTAFFTFAMAIFFLVMRLVPEGSLFSERDDQPGIVIDDSTAPRLDDPTEASIPPPLVFASGFNRSVVSISCDSLFVGFGWEYASTDIVTMPISSCRISRLKSTLSQGALVVVASASREKIGAQSAENNRARLRGFNLGWMLRSRQRQVDDPAQIVIVNLGMSLTGPIGEKPTDRYDPDQRPIQVYKFEPVPNDSVYDRTQLHTAIGDFLRELAPESEFSLCEIYQLDRDGTPLSISNNEEKSGCEGAISARFE